MSQTGFIDTLFEVGATEVMAPTFNKSYLKTLNQAMVKTLSGSQKVFRWEGGWGMPWFLHEVGLMVDSPEQEGIETSNL